MLAGLLLVVAGCGGGRASDQPSSSPASPAQTTLTSEEKAYMDRAYSIGRRESAAWDIINVGANGNGAKLKKTVFSVFDLESAWLDAEPPSDRVSRLGEYMTAATHTFSDAVVEFVKAIKTRDPVHGHAATRLETRGMNLLVKAAKEATRLSKKYGVEQ
jgi:hypothetical protein